MYDIDPDLYFAIFIVVATGVVIGGLFLYTVFVSFVGLMTWVSIKLGWDEDDDVR